MESINQENWTYTHYSLGDMRVKIALGGEVHGDQYQELYFVSVLDSEHQELSQKVFLSLDEALVAINQGHQMWDFVDESLKPQGSGCSSCQAH